MANMTEGTVATIVTAGQDTIQAISSERDATTVALVTDEGFYVRVYLDGFGRYRIWLGHMEAENDGALVARGELHRDAPSRLMERKELRERYDKLCQNYPDQDANRWLAAMTRLNHIQAESLDHDDLLDWKDTGGARATIPQRFRNLWKRLVS